MLVIALFQMSHFISYMSLVTCHMSLTTTARPTVCPSAKSPTMQNCPVCKDQQTLNLLFLWAILAPSEQKIANLDPR